MEERIRLLNAQQAAEREEFILWCDHRRGSTSCRGRFLGLTAPVSVDLDPEDLYGDDLDELSRHLLDAAIAAAPIPRTVIHDGQESQIE